MLTDIVKEEPTEITLNAICALKAYIASGNMPNFYAAYFEYRAVAGLITDSDLNPLLYAVLPDYRHQAVCCKLIYDAIAATDKELAESINFIGYFNI